MTRQDSAYRDHPLRAYTIEEAADILSCEPGWLEELAQQGKVTYTELSGTPHFTNAHLAAIEAAYEKVPPGLVPPSAAQAHTVDQAVALIGGTCKESWLREQARNRKIPFTLIGGAYHFTDAQISEILRIYEVLPPRPAMPAPRPPRTPAASQVIPSGATVLQAREPRSRKRRDP